MSSLPTSFGIGSADRFHTTTWSLVVAACRRESDEALGRLWRGLLAAGFTPTPRSGYRCMQRQDLTQEFFGATVGQELPASLSIGSGVGFRCPFLLAGAQAFLANDVRRAGAET